MSEELINYAEINEPKTDLGIKLWELEDKPHMDDFNEAHEKIDELIRERALEDHADASDKYGRSSAVEYGHAMAGSATPKMNSVANIGIDNGKFAREGHVHPVDTSRAPKSHASSSTTYGAATSTSYGHVRFATDTEVINGVVTDRAVTPKQLKEHVKDSLDLNFYNEITSAIPTVTQTEAEDAANENIYIWTPKTVGQAALKQRPAPATKTQATDGSNTDVLSWTPQMVRAAAQASILSTSGSVQGWLTINGNETAAGAKSMTWNYWAFGPILFLQGMYRFDKRMISGTASGNNICPKIPNPTGLVYAEPLYQILGSYRVGAGATSEIGDRPNLYYGEYSSFTSTSLTLGLATDYYGKANASTTFLQNHQLSGSTPANQYANNFTFSFILYSTGYGK